MSAGRWALPEGVEETLPPDSWRLEALRRQLLDRYREAGFELVIPALIEHLPSAGFDGDVDAQTLKMTDPASGRLLRLRADMTPQAARIAALQFRAAAVVRLCYLGSVLRAAADGPGGPRALIQVGCEIFGQPDLSADLEALELMLLTLSTAAVAPLSVGLGHAGIYRALA
ncbi:MAG: ATP phosphoribosyltransferase regulatory subunit, partial [Gammaproteobacteria bacterium]|nr:ATP phosphoribosyltransferase regulatory subunit [Gammaproteobacteria bacterium]